MTDSASGMFGILEIWKVKIDWICGAVERERKKCIKIWCQKLYREKASWYLRRRQKHKVSWDIYGNGFLGRSKMVVVECFAQ